MKAFLKWAFMLLVVSLAFGAIVANARAYPAKKWCGMFARHELVSSDPGPEYNQACNWRNYGRPTYAHDGALVIWCTKNHHHVGKIVGQCEGERCPVLSGNDGHAVRKRMRSVAGAEFRE